MYHMERPLQTCFFQPCYVKYFVLLLDQSQQFDTWSQDYQPCKIFVDTFEANSKPSILGELANSLRSFFSIPMFVETTAFIAPFSLI